MAARHRGVGGDEEEGILEDWGNPGEWVGELAELSLPIMDEYLLEVYSA